MPCRQMADIGSKGLPPPPGQDESVREVADGVVNTRSPSVEQIELVDDLSRGFCMKIIMFDDFVNMMPEFSPLQDMGITCDILENG